MAILRLFQLTTVLVLLTWLPGCSTPQTPVQPRDFAILCHYMTWFQWRQQDGIPVEDHWSWSGPSPHHPDTIRSDGKRDIASVYYPRIGLYDSADPQVIDYHILTAKAVGIQAFVVDWYGPSTTSDEALQVLFDRAELLDFKIAICLEEKLCFPDWNPNIQTRAQAADCATGLIADLIQRYANRKSYWRHHGKPVAFIFNGWGDWGERGSKTFTGPEWDTIVARAQSETRNLPLSIVPQHFNLQGSTIAGAYGWVGDPDHITWVTTAGNQRLAEGTFDYYIAPANPGFNDTGVWGWGTEPRITPRNPEHYAAYWDALQTSKADAVQIITWNDFQEGTVIEPTAEDGHYWVDETERQIGLLTGRPVDLQDNILPYAWFLAAKANRPEAPLWYQQLITGNQFDSAFPDGNSLPPYISAAAEFDRIPLLSQAGQQRQAALAHTDHTLMQHVQTTASTIESSNHPPGHATDGLITTRWASASADDQWLLLSWPRPVTASQLIIAWETAFASDYRVDILLPDQTWQTVTHQTRSTGGTISHPLPDQPFTQLKLTCLKRATSWGNSIYEIALIP